MAHRRTRFVRGNRSHRETMWFAIPPVAMTIAAASTRVLVASFNAAALLLRPFTIVRTHLAVHVHSDQSAATETYGMGVGFAVVNDAAAAAGVGSVPSPYTNQDSDLFYLYGEIFSQFEFLSAVGVNPNEGLNLQIDSKAMRKVNNDQDLVIVVETPSTANSAAIHTSGRMLVKLH